MRPLAHLPRVPILIALTALAALLSACSAYRLGAPSAANGANPAYSAIFVPLVRNESYAPQVRTLLTEQLRESITADADFSLAAEAASADAVLEVTVTDYRRRETATRVDDTGRGFAYALVLGARFTLRSADGTRTWFAAVPVSAESTVYAAPDLVDAEYQNLPVLASELSRRILHRISDQW